MGYVIDSSGTVLGCAQLFAATLAAAWNELVAPGPLGSYSAYGTDYNTQVLAWKDSAQAVYPVVVRVVYGVSDYGPSLRLRLAFGSWDGAAFVPQGDGLTLNTNAGGVNGCALAVNSAGALLLTRSSANSFAHARLGRCRARSGAAVDGALMLGHLGSAVAYYPKAGFALSGSRATAFYPAQMRPENSVETLLIPELIMVGGGIVSPATSPWETLLAGAPEWAAQGQRRLVFGNAAYPFLAPLPGDGAYGVPGGVLAVFPLEVPS